MTNSLRCRWALPAVIVALSACYTINHSSAVTLFTANPSNVSLVTNGASGDTGLISTGTAADPLWYSPGGGSNNTGFSSTATIQTLNGASILATDVVKYTLRVTDVVDSPVAPDGNGSTPDLAFWGLEMGFAPAFGTFRPTDNALFLLDGRGSTDTRSNVGYSPNNIFGQVQANLPGTSPAGEGVTEESLLDGFTLEITADATGFTPALSGIETNITGATTMAFSTEPWGATDFVSFMSGSYFYATAQGGGQFNVGVAKIELNPTDGLDGDYNDDGSVDAADYTVWRDGNSPDSSPDGYTLWRSNYGALGTPEVAASTAPEPASGVLAVLSALALISRRGRELRRQ